MVFSRIRVLCAALAATLMVSLAYAQPAPGDLVEVVPTGTVSAADVRAEASLLFETLPTPRIDYAVDTFLVRYLTTDFDGSLTEIRAQLFIPQTPVPRDFPLHVFGSGTTGIADVCAPSLEQPLQRRWGFYRANMMAYAARGFVTMFPDYLGFHNPERSQPYFSAVAESRVMLDAIRASFNFFEQHGADYAPLHSLSDHVFTSGYSQGGHAAFAAADAHSSYAPEVPLSGAISFGGTANVETLMREGPYYSPYIAYAYTQIYGEEAFPLADIFQDRWLATLERDVMAMCVDQFQNYFPFDGRQLYRPAFFDALHSGRLAEEFPSIHAILRENYAGISGHGIPGLVVHGEQDIIITTPEQTRWVRDLCETGSAIRYIRHPGIRHRMTRQAGFEDSIVWMEAIMAGEMPSDCLNLP